MRIFGFHGFCSFPMISLIHRVSTNFHRSPGFRGFHIPIDCCGVFRLIEFLHGLHYHFYGFHKFCGSSDFHGFPWIPIDFIDSMVSHGFPWMSWTSLIFMASHEFHGFTWVPWIPWISIDFHGFHGFPWIPLIFMDVMDFIDFHGFH